MVDSVSYRTRAAAAANDRTVAFAMLRDVATGATQQCRTAPAAEHHRWR